MNLKTEFNLNLKTEMTLRQNLKWQARNNVNKTLADIPESRFDPAWTWKQLITHVLKLMQSRAQAGEYSLDYECGSLGKTIALKDLFEDHALTVVRKGNALGFSWA